MGRKEKDSLDRKKIKKEKKVAKPKKVKVKGDSFIKKILARYNFKLLKQTVSSYGYDYSFKKFMITFLVVLIALTGLAFYLKINLLGITLIILEVVLALPFIVDAQFSQLYQIKRFEMVKDYLDNILPIFQNSPKIVSAWESTLDMLDGEMEVAVKDALDYLSNNTDDVEAEETAFAIIEKKFPNSRIHSVHQMMYTIDKENSVDYVESIDNMYYDVQAWISRVFNFQKEIERNRTSLIMLCLLSILCSCFMTQMFGDSEAFSGYTNNIAYQISSVGFLGLIVLCICLSFIKLTGSWLVDDKTVSQTESFMKDFEYIKTHTKEQVEKESKKLYIVAGMMVAVGVFFYIKDSSNMTLLLLCLFLGYLIGTQKTRAYKMHSKKIKLFLEIEFPVWMRDVALNIHNYTVVNAIAVSKETSSDIMAYYIDKFLEDVGNDPASILPYSRFLKEFDIEGVSSNMKILYSLKNLSKEQSQIQINSLIIRNQSMLEKSEALRNENLLTGVKLLGFVPTVLFMFYIVISMGVLFTYMISNLMGSLTI